MAGLYQPSPAIPLASAADRWAKVIDASAREASGLVAKAERNGGRLGKGDASKFLSLVTTLEATGKISGAESKVAATALAPLLGEMRATLGNLLADLPEHAERSVSDLAVFLGQRGQTKVANRGALAALAARTTQNMTSDWTRLAVQTRDGIVEATSRAMGAGLNPKDAARVMSQGVTDVGNLTYARANTIARTEMADLYDASRLAYMGGDPDVEGWVWRARPDACPICQIQHGRFFAPTDPPHRHHNCRCLIVPIPKSLVGKVPPKPGDYVQPTNVDQSLLEPLYMRSRADIRARLPKSWDVDPLTDLRTLVATRQNPGWRPSLTLQRPGGPLRPGKINPPPPAPPAPATPPAPPTPPATPAVDDVEAALRVEAEQVRAEFAARGFGVDPEAQARIDRMNDAYRKWQAEEDYVSDLDPGPERTKAKKRAAALNREYSQAGADWSNYRESVGSMSGGVSEAQAVEDYQRLVAVGRKARAQARALAGPEPGGMRAAQYSVTRAKANRGLLDRLRGTGQPTKTRTLKEGVSPTHDGSVSGSGKARVLSDRARRDVLEAHEVYPTDWLDDADNILDRSQWAECDRGYNEGGGRFVMTSPDRSVAGGTTYLDTAIHELGHTFQKARVSVARAETAFWRRRAGVLGKTTKKPFAGWVLEQPEMVAHSDKGTWQLRAAMTKDRPTPHAYTTKVYAFDGQPTYETRSWEVFTMGVQELLGGTWNYSGLRRHLDDEYEDWLWGVLLCL